MPYEFTNPTAATIPDSLLPLGYLGYIVEPNGLVAVAKAHQEAVLTRFHGIMVLGMRPPTCRFPTSVTVCA
jgi:hypothetical protein